MQEESQAGGRTILSFASPHLSAVHSLSGLFLWTCVAFNYWYRGLGRGRGGVTWVGGTNTPVPASTATVTWSLCRIPSSLNRDTLTLTSFVVRSRCHPLDDQDMTHNPAAAVAAHTHKDADTCCCSSDDARRSDLLRAVSHVTDASLFSHDAPPSFDAMGRF